MSTTALAIAGVRSGYGESMVIRGVDLEVRQGEIFALLGKNGMGKSTLLKTIMGFLPIVAGTVQLFGQSVGGLPPHRIARRALAYTPQEFAIFQDLTVGENLKLGMGRRGKISNEIGRIGEIFPFIPNRLRQRAGTLSGGEQKMVLVARALMARPKLILVDEISEGLQPSVIDRLTTVFRDELRQNGTSILLIEQNVRFALSVAGRYAVLKLGTIADTGTVGSPGLVEHITQQLSV